jgi:hypothetical protein
MSKHNKVNPGQYHVAGRLTPDEAARERVKQRNTPASAAETSPRQTAARKKAESSTGAGRPKSRPASNASTTAAGAGRRTRVAGRSRS